VASDPFFAAVGAIERKKTPYQGAPQSFAKVIEEQRIYGNFAVIQEAQASFFIDSLLRALPTWVSRFGA
jgi:hypothetical protein